jgi:hypothetical protein
MRRQAIPDGKLGRVWFIPADSIALLRLYTNTCKGLLIKLSGTLYINRGGQIVYVHCTFDMPATQHFRADIPIVGLQ